VFLFSAQLLYETFLILRRTEQDMIKNVYWFSHNTLYSCPVFVKLEFSLQIFLKVLKYQISWKSVWWEPSCSMQTDGHMDRQTWS